MAVVDSEYKASLQDASHLSGPPVHAQIDLAAEPLRKGEGEAGKTLLYPGRGRLVQRLHKFSVSQRNVHLHHAAALDSKTMHGEGVQELVGEDTALHIPEGETVGHYLMSAVERVRRRLVVYCNVLQGAVKVPDRSDEYVRTSRARTPVPAPTSIT